MNILRASNFIALRLPELIVPPGLPEFFADVAVLREHGETMRIFLCRELDGHADQVEASALLHMPRGGWQRSHSWAHGLFSKTPH